MSANSKANDEAKCSALIQEKNMTTETAMDIDVAAGNDQMDISGTKEIDGFDRGLQPDRIVTVSQTDGTLMFLVAWKNPIENEADLIEASVIYRKCPLLALEFFKQAFDTSLKNETSSTINKQ